MSHLLRSRTVFSSLDYRELPALLKAENDVVYMDPPYQGTSSNRDRRYLGGIDINEFSSFLGELNKLNIVYAVSYDGHKAGKTYGLRLPSSLGLRCLELNAGRSSQSTLLGAEHITYESLYLSPALVSRLQTLNPIYSVSAQQAGLRPLQPSKIMVL